MARNLSGEQGTDDEMEALETQAADAQDYSESDEEDIAAQANRYITCFEDPDLIEMPNVDVDEDTFGMAVVSLTRDSWHLSKNGCKCSRVTRVITSLFVVTVTITLQIALLYYVKEYVTQRAVAEVRGVYDIFEKTMYNCAIHNKVDGSFTIAPPASPTNCFQTINNKTRGKPEFLPPLQQAVTILRQNFTEGEQDAVCHIPLSQQNFFFLILLVWTLTCITELKNAFNLAWSLFMLPTINSMAACMTDLEDDNPFAGQVIVGMTCYVKSALCTLVLLPRVSVTLFLLWTGCRWLLATTSFGDLILNAVALEFILLIKEVIYAAITPVRSKLSLANTKIAHHPKHMSAAWYNFASSFTLLVVAIGFVILYMMCWQGVLPDYQWDVHEICKEHIRQEYAR